MTKFLINAGKYRHIIVIQKRNSTQNKYGESTEAWVDFIKVRAGIYPLSGREFFSADAVNSEVSHKVHLRYVPGITPDMRINFNGRFFRIISVINFQELNKELQLLCKELV
jgi:SPP1 family predicted phage head-tail adaptor